MARLELQDFRNYRAAELELAPGLNLVVGRNAQGKTNLLEAVACLQGLGSPRGPDAPLVRDGAERAVIHGDVRRGARSIRIDLELQPGRGPRALVNRTPVRGTRPLAEAITAVYFGPDELSLVKGGPDKRRRFIDDLVVKLRPARDGIRKDWERILKQRNALLRSAPRSAGADLTTLEVWDESFVAAGAAMTAARIDALAAIAPFARKRYEEIAGSGALELAYSSSWLADPIEASFDELPSEPELAARLGDAVAAVRSRELERGLSLVGPHRDDISVRLSHEGGILEARTHASQGDQRTTALALRLSEHDVLSDALGEQPILLLDDVFSELDPNRRRWLVGSVEGLDQTIVTSAEPGAEEASGPAQILRAHAGTVDRVD